MRLLEGPTRLDAQMDDARRRHRPVRLRERAEVGAVEVLHRDVVDAVVARAEVEDAHRVRALELAREGRLSPEQRERIRRRRRGAEDLERHVPLQRAVTSEPDLVLSAPADRCLESVATELPRLVELHLRGPRSMRSEAPARDRRNDECVLGDRETELLSRQPRGVTGGIQREEDGEDHGIDERDRAAVEERIPRGRRDGARPHHRDDRKALDVEAARTARLRGHPSQPDGDEHETDRVHDPRGPVARA